jgi:hypothetical protein
MREFLRWWLVCVCMLPSFCVCVTCSMRRLSSTRVFSCTWHYGCLYAHPLMHARIIFYDLKIFEHAHVRTQQKQACAWNATVNIHTQSVLRMNVEKNLPKSLPSEIMCFCAPRSWIHAYHCPHATSVRVNSCMASGPSLDSNIYSWLQYTFNTCHSNMHLSLVTYICPLWLTHAFIACAEQAWRKAVLFWTTSKSLLRTWQTTLSMQLRLWLVDRYVVKYVSLWARKCMMCVYVCLSFVCLTKLIWLNVVYVQEGTRSRRTHTTLMMTHVCNINHVHVHNINHGARAQH